MPTDTPPTIPATPTAKPSCTGDCDGNGLVAINELIVGVNIVLNLRAKAGLRSIRQLARLGGHRAARHRREQCAQRLRRLVIA